MAYGRLVLQRIMEARVRAGPEEDESAEGLEG